MSKRPLSSRIKQFLWRIALLGLAIFVFLIIYLDSIVRDEFDQQAWKIPAKVYARPLSFVEGKSLTVESLIRELQMLGYRKKIKAVNQGEFEHYIQSEGKRSSETFVINTRGFKFWDGEQPAQVVEITIQQQKIIQLKDFANQKDVNFMRLDPLPLGVIDASSGGRKSEDRQIVSLSQVPDHFVTALLNTEDRDFYSHYGVSPKGIARAFVANITSGKLRQGGSTLTQQLMKNHFLTNEKSLTRKAKEALMAVLTEIHYDKNIILEAYINEVFLGQENNIAIHGFQRASEFYFDKPLAELNLSQSALLVGLVKGPSLYNPRRNPDLALKRRNVVLKQLNDNGLITDDEYEYATTSTLQVVNNQSMRKSKVPAFMDFIQRELRQEYTLSQLHKDGLKLFTTLDPVIQQDAERSLTRNIEGFENNNRALGQSLQGALIVGDIQSGDIVAMVGDKNPNFVGFNRALDAFRQTGSVIKPFVYLAALASPDNYNLASLIKDESFQLEGSDGSFWVPKNYDGKEHGEISLLEAITHSYNLATARLALAVGIDKVINLIEEAGFNRELPAYPSVALGAKEMSPLEVLRLYQTLANDGLKIESSGILAVQDHQGNLLKRYPRVSEQKLEKPLSFLSNFMLTKVVESGTAKQIKWAFPNRNYAGKTGTTNDLRDSWYVGYGGSKLSVVWLGRDDNQPAGLTGSNGALHVWKDLYSQINDSSLNKKIPDSLIWSAQGNGFLSNFTDCAQTAKIPMFKGYLPKDYRDCD